jgi:hypothetical protein
MIYKQTIEGITLHMSSFKTPKKQTHLNDLEASLKGLKHSGELFIFLLMNLSKKKVNKDFFFKWDLINLIFVFIKNPDNFKLKFFFNSFDVFLNLCNYSELYEIINFNDFLNLISLANVNQVFKEREMFSQFSMSLFLGFLQHSNSLNQKDINRILEDTYKFIKYSECIKSSMNKKSRTSKFTDMSRFIMFVTVRQKCYCFGVEGV